MGHITRYGCYHSRCTPVKFTSYFKLELPRNEGRDLLMGVVMEGQLRSGFDGKVDDRHGVGVDHLTRKARQQVEIG